MRKATIWLAVFCLTAGFAARAEAELKVGVVDLQKAMELSGEGAKAKAIFQRQVEKVQRELQTKQDELNRMKEELERQSLLLSDAARGEKQSAYQDNLKEFKRLYEDAQEELRRHDAKLSERILKELQVVIEEVGEKGGYDLILEKTQSAVLFRATRIDITDEVIRKYDAGNP